MSVVILKWNPGVSSWSIYDHVARIVKNNKKAAPKMNWSVHEHDKIKKGDRCFILKVGFGANGIVDSGVILSKPYESYDWSDEGRGGIFYADFESRLILNHDAVPILSSEELKKSIPDFDWLKGHSGAVLSDAQASKFLELWENYLNNNRKIFIEKIQNNRTDAVFWNAKELKSAVKELKDELSEKYSVDGKISYCSVRLGKENKTFYYIDPTGKIKEGDYVRIPFGQRNSTKNGIVDSVKCFSPSKVPYPILKTKCILEKIENPDADIIESLRQPLGEEVCKWKSFTATLRTLAPNMPVYLTFKKDGRSLCFIITKFGGKILIVFENKNKNDVELYPNTEAFLKATLFNLASLKDLWNCLVEYSAGYWE